MLQIIHITDRNDVPKEGSMVAMNCGVMVSFNRINANWNDGRVCRECLAAHRDGRCTVGQKTFAVLETIE